MEDQSCNTVEFELAKDYEATLQRLQAENEHLREIASSFGAENEELANDLLDVLAENKELEKELQETLNKNTMLRVENKAMQAKCDKLEERFENMLQASEMEETIMKIKYSVKQQMRKFSEEKQALEKQLSKVALEKENMLEDFQKLRKAFYKIQQSSAEKDLVIKELMMKAIEERSMQIGYVNKTTSLNSQQRHGEYSKTPGPWDEIYIFQ